MAETFTANVTSLHDDTECIHGLESAWCAICIHGPKPYNRRVGGIIAGWASMEARMDSKCPECRGPIETGDHIYREKGSNDTWSCRRCAEEAAGIL